MDSTQGDEIEIDVPENVSKYINGGDDKADQTPRTLIKNLI